MINRFKYTIALDFELPKGLELEMNNLNNKLHYAHDFFNATIEAVITVQSKDDYLQAYITVNKDNLVIGKGKHSIRKFQAGDYGISTDTDSVKIDTKNIVTVGMNFSEIERLLLDLVVSKFKGIIEMKIANKNDFFIATNSSNRFTLEASLKGYREKIVGGLSVKSEIYYE